VVVGRNDGVIENCNVVKDSSVASSLVKVVSGMNNDSYGRVGSIAGANVGTIRNCTSSINPTGYRSVGGIVGFNQGTVEDCTFTGQVNSDQTSKTESVSYTVKWIGGFVGYNAAGTIRRCKVENTSAVIAGTLDVGGFVGAHFGGTITWCYAKVSRVYAQECVGGFCGYNTSTISKCYSDNNKVDCPKYVSSGGSTYYFDAVAGFIGGMSGGSVSYCYSRTQYVYASNYGAGFITGDTGTISYSFSYTATARWQNHNNYGYCQTTSITSGTTYNQGQANYFHWGIHGVVNSSNGSLSGTTNYLIHGSACYIAVSNNNSNNGSMETRVADESTWTSTWNGFASSNAWKSTGVYQVTSSKVVLRPWTSSDN
jgi:hypothetical protein